MAKTIHKITLKLTDAQEVDLPFGAEMLFAREQHEQLCVWYRCNPTEPKQTRKILICGTGHPAPTAGDSNYIGTGMLQGGMLVLHVFEQI